MANLDLTDTLTTLRHQRKQLRKELRTLDKAITALRGVGSTNYQLSRSRRKRKLSLAARRKIALAQRKRWAKFRAVKRAKA